MEKKEQNFSPEFCVDAIEWAARKVGKSYGNFSASLDAQMVAEVYQAYYAVRLEKEKKEKARIEAYQRACSRGKK